MNEESKDYYKFLQKLCRITSKRVNQENKALNLPSTYIEGNKIIREFPDGRKEIIGTI
jgi:hypothetical protein